MKRLLGKYGTDSRFPYWSGAVLDRCFLNAATTVALIVNWSAVAFVATDLLVASQSLAAAGRSAVAAAVCVASAKLIWHDDRLVRTVVRAYVCGVPLVVMLILAAQGMNSG